MRRVVAVLGLVLLAGCGSSGPTFDTAFDLAAALGCEDFKADSQQVFFVEEGGECRFAGGTVDIFVYNSNSARDNWIEAAFALGGRIYAQGDRFVIAGEVRDEVQAAAALVDAELL